MKFLHTSDWHLGRSLYGRKRYDEFTSFLDWLCKVIEDEHIDALLVAGDIFDTSTPSNRAQELYYRFLCRVAGSECRHIVIIAGNHDSASFLNAPRELLKALNVHVVGSVSEHPEDEVIVLGDEKDQPRALVCAVPYLRDRDIRTVEAGESIDDKNSKLLDGLRNHYRDVCLQAEELQAGIIRSGVSEIPIVAMGHLFAAGGKTIEGDGVRELYVGSIDHVGSDAFPSSIDYLALGHLHVAQCVGQKEHIRYSGSPLPMGYGEAGQKKKVLIVEFKGRTPLIRELNIPCFQILERVAGTMEFILSRLEEFKSKGSNAWLEIEYSGTEIIGDLRQILDDTLAGSDMEIRRIRNKRVIDMVPGTFNEDENLDDLSVNDVFIRCLDSSDVPVDERPELIHSYDRIVQSLQEEDVNIE